MTKYKHAILDIINMSHGHLTADDVFVKLKEIYPDVVLATVYNNLNSLTEEELIRKISIEGQIDRYDKIIKHDHLVCKKCGKLVDINLEDYTKTLSKQTGIEILGYDLKVFFVCDECKEKEKNK